MEKKYELIPSDKEGLYRIKALKDFYDVLKGDIGGYIQSEDNLSQLGDCWIYDNAKVCDNAVVIGKAIVSGNARVYDNAQVCGKAIVSGNARVYDNARIRDHAIVQHDVVVYGDAQICGDAMISSDKDYIVFKNWWSSGRYFTWTRSNNMWKVGCFYGSGELLIAKAYKDSKESGFEYKKIVDYVESILENQRLNYMNKDYTSVEQSQKLIKLGIDKTTSDMHYDKHPLENYYSPIPIIGKYSEIHDQFPCWSLTALLGFIPNYKLSSEHNYHTCTADTSFGTETVGWFDCPVDACVEMIEKLHNLKML